MVKLDLPLWVAQVWRTLNWVLMAALCAYWIGTIISSLRHEHRVPNFSAWGQAALLVFTIRAAIGQVEKWKSPMALESGPPLTVALLCAVANLVALNRASRDG